MSRRLRRVAGVAAAAAEEPALRSLLLDESLPPAERARSIKGLDWRSFRWALSRRARQGGSLSRRSARSARSARSGGNGDGESLEALPPDPVADAAAERVQKGVDAMLDAMLDPTHHPTNFLTQAMNAIRLASAAIETENEAVPYQLQADLQQYTAANLRARSDLRENPAVQAMIRRHWDLAQKSAFGGVDRNEYIRLNMYWYKHLTPPEAYDAAEALRNAEEDWREDCGGSPFLNYDRFSDALFELIDTWTATAQEGDYVAALEELWDAVRGFMQAEEDAEDWAKARAKREARQKEKEEKAAALRRLSGVDGPPRARRASASGPPPAPAPARRPSTGGQPPPAAPARRPSTSSGPPSPPPARRASASTKPAPPAPPAPASPPKVPSFHLELSLPAAPRSPSAPSSPVPPPEPSPPREDPDAAWRDYIERLVATAKDMLAEEEEKKRRERLRRAADNAARREAERERERAERVARAAVPPSYASEKKWRRPASGPPEWKGGQLLERIVIDRMKVASLMGHLEAQRRVAGELRVNGSETPAAGAGAPSPLLAAIARRARAQRDSEGASSDSDRSDVDMAIPILAIGPAEPPAPAGGGGSPLDDATPLASPRREGGPSPLPARRLSLSLWSDAGAPPDPAPPSPPPAGRSAARPSTAVAELLLPPAAPGLPPARRSLPDLAAFTAPPLAPPEPPSPGRSATRYSALILDLVAKGALPAELLSAPVTHIPLGSAVLHGPAARPKTADPRSPVPLPSSPPPSRPASRAPSRASAARSPASRPSSTAGRPLAGGRRTPSAGTRPASRSSAAGRPYRPFSAAAYGPPAAL